MQSASVPLKVRKTKEFINHYLTFTLFFNSKCFEIMQLFFCTEIQCRHIMNHGHLHVTKLE